MPRRKGLPAELEAEIIAAIAPILKKYRDMKKSHMSKDRIWGIAYSAFLKTCRLELGPTKK